MAQTLVNEESLKSYIGQGVDATFLRINFLVHEGADGDAHDSLMPGRFLIALRSGDTNSPLGKPSVDGLLRDKLYLMRIADARRVPDSGSIGQLCQRIMDHRVDEIAQVRSAQGDAFDAEM